MLPGGSTTAAAGAIWAAAAGAGAGLVAGLKRTLGHTESFVAFIVHLLVTVPAVGVRRAAGLG